MTMRCALCDQLDGLLFNLEHLCAHLKDAHDIEVGVQVEVADVLVPEPT